METPGGHDGLPVTERLQRLRQYRQSWRTLRWAKSEMLPCYYTIWELTGGHLAQGLCPNRDAPDKFFALHKLPGASRGISGGYWKHSYGNGEFIVPVLDFAMDPDQDLLILAS